jgi:hypothetical protein
VQPGPLETVPEAVSAEQNDQQAGVRLTASGRAADKTPPIKFIMKDTSAPPNKRKRKKKTVNADAQVKHCAI